MTSSQSNPVNSSSYVLKYYHFYYQGSRCRVGAPEPVHERHSEDDDLTSTNLKFILFVKLNFIYLPTSNKVRAYPGPSRFMLVLFASLNAGFEPDLALGLGVEA